MAQTKVFETGYTTDTTEEMALNWVIQDTNLLDYFNNEEKENKRFKITLTVEEIPS